MKALFLNPKKLFLIDSLGALLSAFMLGVLLVYFQNEVGMPKNILYFFAIMACCLSIYSFLNFLLRKNNWSPFLYIIAYANLFYCFITIGFVVYHFNRLTIIGLLYFIAEIIILILLASMELKLASKLSKSTL